jgi:hypothetical protein
MRKPQIAIKLSPKKYAGLANLGNRVHSSMTGNVNFTTPAVTMAALQAAITDVENGLALWRPLGNRGSHNDLTALQEKSLTLSQLLKAEADYVQTTAQLAAGSDYPAMAAIMTSSGFELRSDGSPQGVLEAVENFHRFISRNLAPNQIKLKWKRPLNVTSKANVKSYRILRGTTNVFSAGVEIGATTRTSFLDTNSTGASQTWFLLGCSGQQWWRRCSFRSGLSHPGC